jgi:hypothetical protein
MLALFMDGFEVLNFSRRSRVITTQPKPNNLSNVAQVLTSAFRMWFHPVYKYQGQTAAGGALAMGPLKPLIPSVLSISHSL